MESLEIQQLLDMNYDELVKHLLKKYGGSQYDYFANDKCRSKSKKVTRGKEGLFCHHIDEDKAILLGNKEFAIRSPFEYQKADRLVYCNILEHLILHIKIYDKTKNDVNILGFGGAVKNIAPRINDYYNGVLIEKEWEKKSFELIKQNYDDYINILKYFVKLASMDPVVKPFVDSDSLSVGTDRKIVKKICSELSKFNDELY